MTKRTERLGIRLSPEEKTALEAKAGNKGISDYVRSLILIAIDKKTV